MNRLDLIHTLDQIAPVLPPSKLKTEVKSDKIVLYKSQPTQSLNNGVCGWQSYEIVILVPDESIVGLDNLYNKVHKTLQSIEGAEFDWDNSLAEQYDATLSAYYRTIRVRFPSQLNY